MVLKCKMCGGNLEITEGSSIATCECCGSLQTIPAIKDEVLQNLFNRATNLRHRSEFDKAADIYEKVIQKDAEESEAYWGLVLCKYGIEYVEDPDTFERVLTCHRSSFDSILADEDYKMALQYADADQKPVYEKEANSIAEVQKGIIALAQKAEPYDVFICYKESDDNGKRTTDSVIANDIYYQLTQEGFKVFYAAITLEDKLGTEYEPYIFSALNTSKVLLSIGTKPEYFNAVWVKNEWSRFLKIMKNDRSKMLIPCYKDMDAYDLPEEFAHLQAQDMSKIGFINDLVRGIKKVIVKEDKTAQTAPAVTVTTAGSSNADALLKRGKMALEDKEWEKADGFFEDVLNQDATCAEAYIGKVLKLRRVSTLEQLFAGLKEDYSKDDFVTHEAISENTDHINEMVSKYLLPGYLDEATIRDQYNINRRYKAALDSRVEQKEKFNKYLESNKNLVRAREYSAGDVKNELENGIKMISDYIDQNITIAKEADAKRKQTAIEEYVASVEEADRKVESLRNGADKARDNYYSGLIAEFEKADSVDAYKVVQNKFSDMKEYKDAKSYVSKCDEKIDELNKKKAAADKATSNKLIIVTIAIIAAIILFVVVNYVIIPNSKYSKAMKMKENHQYEEAIVIFDELLGYKDCEEQIKLCEEGIKEDNYQLGIQLMNEGKYDEAIDLFNADTKYKDSYDKISEAEDLKKESDYQNAISLYNNGKYEEARDEFIKIASYKDSEDYIKECDNVFNEQDYQAAEALLASGDYKGAIQAFNRLENYSDSQARSIAIQSMPEYHATLKVSDRIVYGSYNNQPITWKVVDVQDDRVMLVATDAIESKSFGSTQTWAESELRTWLNETFIDKAFDDAQKTRLVANVHKVGQYADLEDYVSLLTYDEARSMFEVTLVCKQNDSARAWWLIDGSFIDADGKLCGASRIRPSTELGIRPAIWLSTEG